MKKTVYEIAKENILKKLEKAEKEGKKFSWIKPWTGGVDYPCSYEKSTPYRGINTILLDPGEYITYKKVCELQKKFPDQGIKIKKGATLYPVFFFSYKEEKKKNDIENQEEEKKSIKRPIFKYYNVFNISDIINLPSKFEYEETIHQESIDTQRADQIINDFCRKNNIILNINKGQQRAFFSPALKTVSIPDRSQFTSFYEYYSTAFHEIVHSTSLILNRKINGKFGSSQYAQEELIAEIGANMLCRQFHIIDDTVEDNNIAYIQGWSKRIKDESANAVVFAAAQAQKACDLILDNMFVEKDSVA